MLTRLTTRRSFRVASVALGAGMAIAIGAGSAAAQADKCAQLIGKTFRKQAKTGQGDQTKCHALANKICIGASGGVCNDPDTDAFKIADKGKYEKTRTKGLDKINEVGGTCSGQAVVLNQYPAGQVGDTLEFIDEMLADRGELVLGEDNLNCDEAKVTCAKTIAKQRAGVADKTLNAVLKCMKSQAPGLAATRTSCIDDAPAAIASSVAKAEGKISEDCMGLTGNDVGSCDPLPTCVTAAAVAEGQEAGTRAYPDTNCGGTPTANARTASIDIDTPTPLGGLTIEVKYPRLAMGLPGNGDIGLGDFSNFTVAFINGFDLDGTLRISVADFAPIASGQLVDVSFDTCFPLTLGSCEIGGAPCDDDVDCGANAPCNVENGFCSYSEFLNCGDAPLTGCPVGETCSAQQNIAGCTVVAAADTGANPVDGVTCTVTLSEP